MKVYLTETLVLNEIGRPRKWCGPRIEAENWKEAEKQAEELGVTLVGEFASEEDWDDMPDGFAEGISEAADRDWLAGGPKE